MVQSIFDPQNFASIIYRLNKLNVESKPLWGKMNVSQMVTHCQKPLQVVFGELKLKHSLIGKLFGGLARKSLTSEKPFKRNLPTAPQFVVKDERDFEEEKQKLQSLLERFVGINKEELEAIIHPFFGKMTREQWDRLMWKHMDHHLQQFGV